MRGHHPQFSQTSMPPQPTPAAAAALFAAQQTPLVFNNNDSPATSSTVNFWHLRPATDATNLAQQHQQQQQQQFATRMTQTAYFHQQQQHQATTIGATAAPPIIYMPTNKENANMVVAQHNFAANFPHLATQHPNFPLSATAATQPIFPPPPTHLQHHIVPMPALPAAIPFVPTAAVSNNSRGAMTQPPPAGLIKSVALSDGSPAAAAENNGDCWSTAVTGWEQAAMIKNKIGLVINGRFRILQSIASGSYGEIFAAEDMQQLHFAGGKRPRVAVKFDGACRDNHLRYEYQVYKSALYEDGHGKVEGFPQVYWYGHEYGHNIMVMDLLGAPVASLFAFCDRKFARQTIMSLGEQMIHRIRHLHQRGFIHRDIKPENFLMGLAGKESTLYLIDFGLARRYRYRENENRALTHIPFRRGRSFIGTAKYASLNSHKNIELSRRDDLESLAYVLIELINGHLPWKNISKRNATTRHQASIRIRTLKEQTNWEEFCPPMAQFIRYTREIPFNEEPNYDRLLELLQQVAVVPAECATATISSSAIAAPSQKNCRNHATRPRQTSTTCCQTAETAEKMTQVDFEIGDGSEEVCNGILNAQQEIVAQNEKECVSMKLVQQLEQRLSLTVVGSGGVENTSDFDEVGAATTTTSCSENELENGGCSLATRDVSSGTGTTGAVSDGDDELTTDSQPTPQQEQQVCRKCRRLRDQQNQQQKRQQPRPPPPPQQPPQQCSVAQTTATSTMMVESPRKMCWQRARESNPERRFQYENRFSWTLPFHVEQLASSVAPPLPIAAPALRAGAALPIMTHPAQISSSYAAFFQKQQQSAAAALPPMPIPQQCQQPPHIHYMQAVKPGHYAAAQATPPQFPMMVPPPPTVAVMTGQNASSINYHHVSSIQRPFLTTAIPPQALQATKQQRILQISFVVPPSPIVETKTVSIAQDTKEDGGNGDNDNKC